jgi:hypothetical protein
MYISPASELIIALLYLIAAKGIRTENIVLGKTPLLDLAENSTQCTEQLSNGTDFGKSLGSSCGGQIGNVRSYGKSMRVRQKKPSLRAPFHSRFYPINIGTGLRYYSAFLCAFLR